MADLQKSVQQKNATTGRLSPLQMSRVSHSVYPRNKCFRGTIEDPGHHPALTILRIRLPTHLFTFASSLPESETAEEAVFALVRGDHFGGVTRGEAFGERPENCGTNDAVSARGYMRPSHLTPPHWAGGELACARAGGSFEPLSWTPPLLGSCDGDPGGADGDPQPADRGGWGGGGS